MRVLLITPFFPSIDNPLIGRDRYDLVDNLIRKGHEVAVVSLTYTKGSFEGEISDEFEIYRIPVIAFTQRGYPIPDPFVLIKTIMTVGGGYDVHHYYQQEYLTILPSFLSVHSVKVLTVDNFPGLDWFYGDRVVDTFAYLESLTLGRRAIKRFDGVIFLCTRSMKTALALEPSMALGRIRWIPHGIHTQRVKPNKLVRQKVREDLGIDGIAIAFVGRLAPVKGLVYLAKAVEGLDREGFSGHFIIVGDGPERNKLEALRLTNSKIHLLGFRKNPIKYLQAADMLVLPSLGEGCPNTILEAFACGKPVIASNVGGVPDLIKNGTNGILIRPRDSTGLKKAISIMSSDVEKAKRMGMRARRYAEKELDWRIIIERICNFYTTL